jgi:hypothetical protein
LTTTSSGDPRAILIFVVAMVCLAALFVTVVVPFMARFTLIFEAVTLVVEGLGSYFGNSRIIWLGCLFVGLSLIGCCVITVVIAGALFTCTTNNPSQLCRLIGR